MPGQDSTVARTLEGEEVEERKKTDSPVGCSYLPAAGISRVTETDILAYRLMGIVSGYMKIVVVDE